MGIRKCERLTRRQSMRRTNRDVKERMAKASEDAWNCMALSRGWFILEAGAS
jgi:hypothetical protein